MSRAVDWLVWAFWLFALFVALDLAAGVVIGRRLKRHRER